MGDAPKTAIHINGPVGLLKAGTTGNAMADVIAVEMHLNLFIGTGNLKGVSKALFTMGMMTDEFVKAIKAFQKHVVGDSTPDGRVDPNGKTLKFLNGPLTARGGKTEPDELDVPGDVLEARKKIASTARQLLAEGGHFLMGTMGDMPGRANGHPERPANTFPATFFDVEDPSGLGPAVNAAWTTHRNFGRLGCMGRPDAKGIFNEGLITFEDHRIYYLRSYATAIRKMKEANVSHLYWPGFPVYLHHISEYDGASTYSEFMRLIALGGGKNGTPEFPRRINADGAVHLGESCVGVRHYDCIGFVNFVLSKVLRPRWKNDMAYYTNKDNKDLFRVRDLSSAADKAALVSMAEEGDLVAKSPDNPHIGICTVRKGQLVVTNCRSMAEGLLDTPLSAEWSFLARLRSV